MAFDPCEHLGAQSFIRRRGDRRDRFWYCADCRAEWTDTDVVPDLGDTITSDELIEVHALLADDHSLEELLTRQP